VKFFGAALVFFAALTAAMTWPQALHLADAAHDAGDPLLNAWTLAWVAHQLPLVPAHLFDANIFFPERDTLAYSETLLAPAIAAAPLHWLGVPALLVSNLVMLSGFAVSGAGMALLVRSLTGRVGPAIIAGLVFAFLPYRFDHLAHLQLQQTQCLPFVFCAFHRLLQSGRARDGVVLGVFVAGQILSCMYYGLFLLPYMAVVCGALFAITARRLEWTASLRPLIVAAAIAIAAVVPVGVAYLGARATVGERRIAEVAEGSATLWNYLGVPAANRLYGAAFTAFGDDERRLFPGFVAITLALISLWPRDFNLQTSTFRLQTSDFRLPYSLGLLIAVDLSLGVHGITYPLLYEFAVPYRALRVPARMALFTGFSLAVLAGYGAARLESAIASARARRAALAAVGILVLAESWSAPVELMPIVTAPPRVYADLVREVRDGPDIPIVEYPMSRADDPTYMLYSTTHWQRLVNGYSGFFPPSYIEFSDAFRGFPDAGWVGAIRDRGVRYLLVHGERMIGNRYERLTAQIERLPDFALVSRSSSARYGQHGEVSLYRVVYR